MVQLKKLFEPGKIGSMEVKNRLIMSPMGTMSHDPDGFIQDRTIDHFVERARGGVGFIITQSAAILPEGKAPGRAGAWDDRFIPGLRKVSAAVHEAGAKIAWQLAHYGYGHELTTPRTGFPVPEGIRIIAPSAIPWVRTNAVPEAATKEDIERIVEGFGEAARRIKDAGFDAVEIHGAHGKLITQFLSPRDNHRTDEYGGSVENRARFACEVIARIRKKVGPDFPIIFRFSGHGFLWGGITIEQSVLQAPLFAEAGADALDVSVGEQESIEWVNPTYVMPDAPSVRFAEAIKKAVNIPVIAVGKIGDPVLAERILQEGKADFVAMGRALLADPELPNKAKEGRFDEIRYCLFCNSCMTLIRDIRPKSVTDRGICCTVNPALLREKEFVLKPTTSPKHVMVVGGGLAGMEAARVLAERGHSVSLYERTDRLGGQWNIASAQESKKTFARLTQLMERGLQRAGVKITFNKEVTREFIEETQVDAVVVATGAIPATLDIPGADRSNAVQANDVFTGKAKVGNEVVVIGGRLVAMEVAVLLAEQGKKVSLVTKYRLGEDGRPLQRYLFKQLRNRLVELGVFLYPDSPAWEIVEKGVYIAYQRELLFLEADTVVLSVGAKSQRGVLEELKGLNLEVYAIGDCVEPRDAADAIREGAEVGRQI